MPIFLSFCPNTSNPLSDSIIKMFKCFSEPYPCASEIHLQADRQIINQFLSCAPYSEFQKLGLRQVIFLRKLATGLTQPKGSARCWINAIGLLLRREREIKKEEEMRKNGVMPDQKAEKSLLGQVGTKISNFFKIAFMKSQKNGEKLLNDQISDRLLLSPND